MSFDLSKLYNELCSNGNLILAYKGSITSELINDILDTIEKKLEDQNEEIKIRKKIYNILVESLQNLYHHVEETHKGLEGKLEPKFGIVLISKDDSQYKVITGNFINTNKIKPLKEKLDKLNSLSKEELKDIYKYILNHQKINAQGGGGLGLVDIARKANGKLEYDFIPYNEDYYFFKLEITIN